MNAMKCEQVIQADGLPNLTALCTYLRSIGDEAHANAVERYVKEVRTLRRIEQSLRTLMKRSAAALAKAADE